MPSKHGCLGSQWLILLPCVFLESHIIGGLHQMCANMPGFWELWPVAVHTCPRKGMGTLFACYYGRNSSRAKFMDMGSPSPLWTWVHYNTPRLFGVWNQRNLLTLNKLNVTFGHGISNGTLYSHHLLFKDILHFGASVQFCMRESPA